MGSGLKLDPESGLRVVTVPLARLQELAEQRRLVILDQPLSVGEPAGFSELNDLRGLIELDDTPLPVPDRGWESQPISWD